MAVKTIRIPKAGSAKVKDILEYIESVTGHRPITRPQLDELEIDFADDGEYLIWSINRSVN